MARIDIADVYHLPIGDEEERGVIVAQITEVKRNRRNATGRPHLGLVIDGNFEPASGSRLGGPRMGLVAGRAHARPNRCRNPRVAV